MERFVCIHGHFYQPPRENPWIEAIEIQDSAHPYHDWDERVTAECYAPNSASRIFDEEHCITDIVSNYAKISFNFGPTLLSWMETFSPEIYQAILDADRQSLEWRSGHGAAIAQVYNHMIMPLATARDKRSQVVWGIKDFEHRFKRFPEGMWLAETAVDLKTLDILAEQGIKYTILAPHQAARVRKIGAGKWKDLGDAQIDTTRGYLCRLPSRRTITLFFYDGPTSRAVAFEKLLENGEGFAQRLLDGFSDTRDWAQLFHIATDGETYGHHQKFGDMALARALHHIETNGVARLTNYGEYLEHHPPTCEVQIVENSSWSCSHGIERWKNNCGCNSGGHPEWNQEWRGPLRDALDWLRDELASRYEEEGKKYLKDPWHARDEYIQVILDRTEDNVNGFLGRHAGRNLNEDEKIAVRRLLESQRHAMLMYTSCGWFFDELSGIETVQIIQYAGRTLQLAEGFPGGGLENVFLERVAGAKSNLTEQGDGARIYERHVKPARVDLTKVGVHYAFSSLFEEYEETARIYCYTVAREDFEKLTAEEAALAVGKITVVSERTGEHERLIFCVVRFGSHDFKGGARPFTDDGAYHAMKEEIITAFEKGYLTEIVGFIDKHFGMHNYSLVHLFRDEKRMILSQIINATLEEFAESYRSMYEHNRPLMEFVQETGMPVPKVFLSAAELALNSEIRKELSEDEPDGEKIQKIVNHMRRWNAAIDSPNLEFFIRRRVEELMKSLCRDPLDFALLTKIMKLMELLKSVPIEIVLWEIQNIYFQLAKTTCGEVLAKARSGDERTAEWEEAFKQFGRTLYFNVASILPDD